jgi:HPt (histidine-containing phosphotransfer) domain-containing protein
MTRNSGNKIGPYDLSYLEELSAGDVHFVKNIVSQFVLEAPGTLNRIQLALKEQNWVNLNYEIHKFASNLSFVGVNDIRETIFSLEMSAKNQSNLNSIPELVNILVGRCELAINSLKKDFEL